MCLPLNAIFRGWEQAPTSHHHLHDHSEEDDCIIDCICCPCNLLCYLLLAIEEFLCCWELLNCFGGGEFKYRPGRGGTLSPQSSLHGCSELSLPGKSGPSRPTLQATKSAPARLRGNPPPRPLPSQLKTSASLRYVPKLCEVEHHCWECERRRHG